MDSEVAFAHAQAVNLIKYYKSIYPDFEDKRLEIKEELENMPCDMPTDQAMARACYAVFHPLKTNPVQHRVYDVSSLRKSVVWHGGGRLNVPLYFEEQPEVGEDVEIGDDVVNDYEA